MQTEKTLPTSRFSLEPLELMMQVTLMNLDFKFFNDETVATSGGPDVAVSPSLGLDQFNEYEFTAGVTDDGIGTPLDEFIAFQIKIVMRATNSARPPRIKDLRI